MRSIKNFTPNCGFDRLERYGGILNLFEVEFPFEQYSVELKKSTRASWWLKAGTQPQEVSHEVETKQSGYERSFFSWYIIKSFLSPTRFACRSIYVRVSLSLLGAPGSHALCATLFTLKLLSAVSERYVQRNNFIVISCVQSDSIEGLR